MKSNFSFSTDLREKVNMDMELFFYYCLIDQVLFQGRKNSSVFYPYIVRSFSRSIKMVYTPSSTICRWFLKEAERLLKIFKFNNQTL